MQILLKDYHVMKALLWISLGFAAAFIMRPALAQEGEEEVRGWNFIEVQHAVTAEFETPHTEWGKPYSGGTIRAVFFAPWFQGSTEGREIVELMQRFDIEGHAVYLMGARLAGDGRPDWYGGDPEAGTNRVLRFIEAGQDAFFINQLTLDTLPEGMRERLREAVTKGAGLVIVGDKAAPFEKAKPVDYTPADLPSGAYFTLGDGRVAVLPSRVKLEYRLGWETEFDYQMQEQGRALLWAAKRESTAKIHIDAPDLERGDLPGKAIELITSGFDPGDRAQVTLRRWDGETVDLPPHDPSAAPRVQLEIPRVREGAYYLDCIAKTAGAVITWATAPFRVTADRHVDSIELEKDWAEIGETVSGHVRLSGNVAPQDRLDVRLTDKWGRILERQRAEARDGAPFTFQIASWAPMLFRVEAALMDGNDEVSYAYRFLRVTKRNRGQFNFIMWNIPSGDLAPYGVESLARYGVTAVLQGGPPPIYLSANELAYVPYAASFRASSHTLTAMLDPETGLLKPGCVHDPEAMAKTIQQAVEGVKTARELGVFAYSLGDENAVRASCLGPKCLRAYQEYLKDVYGDIAALNASWGASYGSFEDIQLLSEGDLPAPDAPDWFKEHFAEQQLLYHTDSDTAEGEAGERQITFGNINDEMRALQQGNFARWYDRQAFQNYSYVHWCKQFQKAFLEIDPQAWTGFEGTDSFTIRKLTTRSRQGGDLDLFVRELDYYGSYEGPGNEVLRSIAPAGFPMGSWIGYTPDVEELLFKYWKQITDRMNTVQWWRWDNLDGYHGYLAPNFAPFASSRDLIEDTQVVRDGLGTLLMAFEMQGDGVAMLYSMPSTYIAHFDGNETYGLYKRDHDRWHELLHSAGVQFRYVTDRMLRLGEFDAARYKVMILPLAFAMSPEEADAVRAFVKQGGTVIADVRPALYDGHCKPLEQGLLNDVFGVEQTGNRRAREIDRMFIDGEINGQKAAMRWGNWHGKDIYPSMKVDPNVALTTGRGLGEAYFIHYWTGLKAPVGVVNEYGKGRAILLNFSIYEAPMARLLPRLLSASGVMPALGIKQPDGPNIKGVEVTRWRNGDIELAALLGKREGEARVLLPEARHIYDLKSHQYLGHVAEFTTQLRPNRASFFAMLPHPSKAPEVRIRGGAERGKVLEVNISVPEARGAHAVLLRIKTPSGVEAPWLKKTIIVRDKPIVADIPIAYNDPAGQWTICATDLYTRQTTMTAAPVN